MKTIYSKFFNLEANPFGETPDPDFYYASHQHNRALLTIDSAIRQGKGFSLLIGEVGTGKTLLTRILFASVAPHANTALILYPKFTELELLQAIVDEFEIPTEHAQLKTTKSYLDLLNQFLLESLEKGKRSVLLIDEAQAMSVEALEMIRLLTNLETKDQKLLQIVLTAQPELEANLNRVELRQLKQRIGARATLQGLDLIETEAYIKSRIEQVGNGNFVRFDKGAIKLIHEFSVGMPRRMNQICEQILVAAESKRVRLIDANFASDALGVKAKSFLSIFSRKERS
jgi:general secretion pathway protein A